MANALRREYASRAVHLLITPRPANLGESREVMRLLSQCGEIEYYKNLKYDEPSTPQTALVIFKEADAARESLRRSPLRFSMGKAAKKQDMPPPSSPSSLNEFEQQPRPASPTSESQLPRKPFSPFGLASTQSRAMSTQGPSIPRPPPGPPRMPFEFLPTLTMSPESPSRIFQILTSPSRRNFRDRVEAGHYHGSFEIDTKTPGQEDLQQKVPRLGLSCVDWNAPDRPWKLVSRQKAQDAKFRRLGLMHEEAMAAADTVAEGGVSQAGSGVDQGRT